MVFVIIQALQNCVKLSLYSSYVLLRLFGRCSLDVLDSMSVAMV